MGGPDARSGAGGPVRPRLITFVAAYLVGETLYRAAAMELGRGEAAGYVDGYRAGSREAHNAEEAQQYAPATDCAHPGDVGYGGAGCYVARMAPDAARCSAAVGCAFHPGHPMRARREPAGDGP